MSAGWTSPHHYVLTCLTYFILPFPPVFSVILKLKTKTVHHCQDSMRTPTLLASPPSPRFVSDCQRSDQDSRFFFNFGPAYAFCNIMKIRVTKSSHRSTWDRHIRGEIRRIKKFDDELSWVLRRCWGFPVSMMKFWEKLISSLLENVKYFVFTYQDMK